MRHPTDKHHHGAFVFRLQKIDNARKSDWFFLFQHHNNMGFTQSSKIWPNLCLLRYLYCSRSFVSNLTPTRSCIKNNHLSFKEKTFFSIDLNCLIISASRMVLSNLFDSLTQKGKKECLKLSLLQENSYKLFLFADLVW